MREWKDGDNTIADALQSWYVLPAFVREYAAFGEPRKDKSVRALGCRVFLDYRIDSTNLYMVGYQFVGCDAVSCSPTLVFVNNANL